MWPSGILIAPWLIGPWDGTRQQSSFELGLPAQRTRHPPERLRLRPKDLIRDLVPLTVLTGVLLNIPELWNAQIITVWSAILVGRGYLTAQRVLKRRKLTRQRETLLEQADSSVPLLRARLEGHL